VSPSESAGIVLVTGKDTVPPDARAFIEEQGFELRYKPAEKLNRQQLHQALADVSGYLIGGNEKPLAEHFEQAAKLQVVAWVGTDFRANVPGWERAFDLGIAVVSTPGENAVSVAEFTLRLILAIARPIAAAPGVELHGRTLGIVGAGRIGARVAKAAALGLGMKVLYTAPRRNEALEAALGIEYVRLADLLERSHVISLHRPGLAPGEQPTLGPRELERIGAGTLLVNTAHYSLIDPAALFEAIELRGLRVAVDGVNPKDRKGLWARLIALGPDRFLYAPDIGYNTGAANSRAGMRAARAVCDVLLGGNSDSVNNQDFRERPPR